MITPWYLCISNGIMHVYMLIPAYYFIKNNYSLRVLSLLFTTVVYMLCIINVSSICHPNVTVDRLCHRRVGRCQGLLQPC